MRHEGLIPSLGHQSGEGTVSTRLWCQGSVAGTSGTWIAALILAMLPPRQCSHGRPHLSLVAGSPAATSASTSGQGAVGAARPAAALAAPATAPATYITSIWPTATSPIAASAPAGWTAATGPAAVSAAATRGRPASAALRCASTAWLAAPGRIWVETWNI